MRIGPAAILGCLTLGVHAQAPAAPAPPPPTDSEVALELAKLQPKIDAAIDRGVAWLLDAQLRDGNWAHELGQYATGQTALCCYTLLKSGLPPAHPAVRRALLAMARVRPGETYTAGCHLLALAATLDPVWRPRIEQITDDLLTWQDGTWGYPHEHGAGGWTAVRSRPDLSCTQYAALGLRAAQAAGVEIPRHAWLDLIDEARRYQDRPSLADVPIAAGRTGSGKAEIAGFRYVLDRGARATGSMTAAGIAVLRIAADGLGDGLGPETAREIERACALGTGWLAQNFRVDENPGGATWTYYYLYGLERVGALLHVDRIGPHPWYLRGADQLVAWQQADGKWARHRPEADTCFALLFLQRATAPRTGAPPLRPHLRRSEAKGAPVRFRVAGGTDGMPVELSVTGFGDALWAEFGSGTVERPRGPRVASVDWLIDGEIVATVPGDPARAWTHEAFAARYEVSRRGSIRVGVRAHLVPPDGGAPVSRDGHELTIEVRHVFASWMQDAISAAERNLVPAAEPRASASTFVADAHAPGMAVDGRQPTCWLATPEDAQPVLTLQFPRPVRATRLLLGQAAARLADAGDYDRITRVRLRVNDSKQTSDHPLDADELAPTAIPLDRSRPIRKLEITILERVPGQKQKGRCGFAEVALEND